MRLRLDILTRLELQRGGRHLVRVGVRVGVKVGVGVRVRVRVRVGGTMLSSCETAFEALPLAVASSHLPSRMKVMSMAAVSNCSLSRPCSPPVTSATTMKTSE